MKPSRQVIPLLAAAMRAYDRTFGLDVELVVCDVCGASWHGYRDDACPWCLEAENRMREWQATLTLTQPDINPNDTQYDGAMQGWADRLENAVAAGIITAQQAERAWAVAA